LDAILAHKELHHPSMINVPDAPLNVRLEMDLTTDKKNKFVDKYHKIIELPYPYDHGEDRTILAFCESTKMMEEARNAGAMLVGGKDVIKSIEVLCFIYFTYTTLFTCYAMNIIICQINKMY
jgi:large subunit ribosomal protein L1